jgi:hypothetical protein
MEVRLHTLFNSVLGGDMRNGGTVPHTLNLYVRWRCLPSDSKTSYAFLSSKSGRFLSP